MKQVIAKILCKKLQYTWFSALLKINISILKRWSDIEFKNKNIVIRKQINSILVAAYFIILV